MKCLSRMTGNCHVRFLGGKAVVTPLTQPIKELDDILDYIGNKLDNAKAAAKLMEDIGRCMETVCVFPEGGALVTNAFLPRKIIRKKVVGNYLLYYRADKERKTVWLLRIVYGRRDMDEVLKHINS